MFLILTQYILYYLLSQNYQKLTIYCYLITVLKHIFYLGDSYYKFKLKINLILYYFLQ